MSAGASGLQIVTSEFAYEQLEEIGVGQGRNSRVFRAYDPQLGGQIAVKEMPLSQFPNPGAYFAEAQAMYRADCPNVVPIRAASTANDRICLVMPYLSNGSLYSRIKGGPLRLKEVIRVGQGILKGLSQIHIANIIHFDLKPSNVLFSSTDEPLVADFGQSRQAHTSGATPIPPLYIPAMPPETIQLRHGDRQSDIFQAGLTLYRAMNGEPVYEAQLAKYQTIVDLQTAVCRERFPDRDGYLPHVPKWLRLAVTRAMKSDPAKRYQSASDFAVALGRHPIRLDWNVSQFNVTGYEWAANRKGQPPLVVRMSPNGLAFDVELYTKTPNGGLRRKDPSVAWRSSLRESDAIIYLRSLFQSLEQA